MVSRLMLEATVVVSYFWYRVSSMVKIILTMDRAV